MAYVYRYTDLADNIIKYVGIVWGASRTLKQRLKEHRTQDAWCQASNYKIEYIEQDIGNRTDAEYFEAHYISLYQTDHWYNIAKTGWGISKYLPNRENDWIEFTDNEGQEDYIKTLESKIKEQTKVISDLKKQNKSLDLRLRKSESKVWNLQDQIIKLDGDINKEYNYNIRLATENNLYEKELSEKYEKEYRKTFDKLSRQISFYEDAQKHNEYYVGSNKEFERIFKHVIYQFDRIIYRKFCLKNTSKELIVDMINCRNKVVANFFKKQYFPEKYYLYYYDYVKQYNNNNKKNSRKVLVTCYTKGSVSFSDTYSSISEASKETGLVKRDIEECLDGQIMCIAKDGIMFYEKYIGAKDEWGSLNWCVNNPYFQTIYVIEDVSLNTIFNIKHNKEK